MINWRLVQELAANANDRTVLLSGMSSTVLISALERVAFDYDGQPLSPQQADAADDALSVALFQLISPIEAATMDYVEVLHTENVGVAGGSTAASTAWQLHKLNTIAAVSSGFDVTLDDDLIYLPEGIYLADCSVSYLFSGSAGRWLRYSLDGYIGNSEMPSPVVYPAAINTAGVLAWSGVINAAGGRLALAYLTNDSRSGDGLGRATNSLATSNEVYARIRLVKL